MKKMISAILALSLMISLIIMTVAATEPDASMKSIYGEKSREEVLDISKFLSKYHNISYEGFDISNPNQEALSSFMTVLLIRNADILPYENLWPEGEYEENWEYGQANRKYKVAHVNKKCMELFGVLLDFENYPVGDQIDGMERGYVYIGDPGDPEPIFITSIKSMYALGGGLIYMDIQGMDTWYWEHENLIRNNLYEELPSYIQSSFLGSEWDGHAIIKELAKNGEKSYKLIKLSASEGQLTQEELLKYMKKANDLLENDTTTSDTSEPTQSQQQDIFKNDISDIPEIIRETEPLKKDVSDDFRMVIWVGMLASVVVIFAISGGAIWFILKGKK